MKVFISSTWQDLQPERNAAKEALVRLRLTVVGMEYFGSDTRPPKEVSLAHVDEMEEEERWKKESQLMIKDSNATATIHTASISDVIGNKAPQGRIIAITRSRPRDWKYKCMPVLAPSWRLLKARKNGYITYQKFKERYLNEMRHLYRSTTILQTFAKECMQESVVLCCYCKGDKFCARTILKEILEKIIHKLKQKVVYPVPQESLEPPKREEAAKYRVRQTKEENAFKKELYHDTT